MHSAVLDLIGRKEHLFVEELRRHSEEMASAIRGHAFLVIGGAGSIGQAVVRTIFQCRPAVLHVVDLSENNLVELVRDLRSSLGYIEGDFQTFPLDAGGIEFQALLQQHSHYDYILNLSALKHVRSEKDPFTLMRMIEVNILNTESVLETAKRMKTTKFFCVSTDKATNPVSMMGASKRIMELFLLNASLDVPVSTARFANVAFSEGSLLHGFTLRIAKRQPISAPRDVKRYFITQDESGVLCVMSCLLAQNREIFFPKLDPSVDLLTFSDIAERYLHSIGFEPDICSSEEEAREKARGNPVRRWPCYFFDSDTTGEKPFEEFYTHQQNVDMERFPAIGVIHDEPYIDRAVLQTFRQEVASMRSRGTWSKDEIVSLFRRILPEFAHYETGRHLDNRM